MSFAVGIYDVFATAIPGSLYLVASIYLAVRFGWVEWDDIAGLNTTFALVGAIVASYILGQALAPTLRHLVERGPSGLTVQDEVRDHFIARNPTLADRPFVQANAFTLLAGLRQVSVESANEVDRSRAVGVMLRSFCPAFLIGAAIAFVEAAVMWHAAPLAIGAASVALAILSLHEGHIRSRWAWMHTFEAATWIPDVDTQIAPPPST